MTNNPGISLWIVLPPNLVGVKPLSAQTLSSPVIGPAVERTNWNKSIGFKIILDELNIRPKSVTWGLNKYYSSLWEQSKLVQYFLYLWNDRKLWIIVGFWMGFLETITYPYSDLLLVWLCKTKLLVLWDSLQSENN